MKTLIHLYIPQLFIHCLPTIISVFSALVLCFVVALLLHIALMFCLLFVSICFRNCFTCVDSVFL